MGKNVRGGKMKKVFLKDKIEFIDEENDCIMGYVTFPKREDNILDLNHTVVNPSYQGQGIAAKLIKEVVEYAKKEDFKIIPTCSYAEKWFEKNEDEKSIRV